MRFIVISLFLNLFFALQHAFTQEVVKVAGIVTDSTEQALELAYVMAIEQSTQRVDSYGSTDSEGNFSLRLIANRNYLIRVTYLGYETFEKEISVNEEFNPLVKIQMRESETLLKELTIEEEFPVTISGDTITYRSDAFVTGNERKLEDVLNAIPGFEVDDNGEVKVQGKTVEKILVEGKEFFEGDTKLATQNIPANAVDKVQVLRNFNDISPMRMVQQDNDRLALNIELDEDKQNLIFGDVEAGGGPKSRHLYHNNLFYFSPKGTMNFIADANNLGMEAFSARDYFRFMGGMSSLSTRSGSTINISEDAMGFMDPQNENALSITSKLAALNFNYVPNKKWNISGFLIGSDTDRNLSSSNNRRYVNFEDENTETLSTDNVQSNLSGLGKFKAIFTPNRDVYLGYNAFVKASGLRNNTFRTSNNLGFQNDIASNSSQDPWSINQQISGYISLNEKNILSFESSYNYQRQDPSLQLTSDSPLFVSLLPIISGDQHLLFQNKLTSTHRQESQFNWYHILSKTMHVNFSFGNTYARQNLKSNTEQMNDLERENLFSNDVDYSFDDRYAGIEYRTKFGKWTLIPGLNLHRYKIGIEQEQEERNDDMLLLLPEFGLNFEILSTQNIRFQYKRNAIFNDAEQLADGLVIRNYNNLFFGNSRLDNAIYHDLGLNYTNFSMFNNFNLFAGMTYQKKFEDFANDITYQNLERLINPNNLDKANEMASLFGDLTKTYRKFKLNGRLEMMYSSNGNSINNIENRNKTWTYQTDFSVETTFFKRFIIELGYSRAVNDYQSAATSNKFYDHRPYTEIELSFFKHFTLVADYTYNKYTSEDGSVNSRFDLANASLLMNKDRSPWTFKLSCMNVFGTNTIRRDGFSESQISTLIYNVQPRYFNFSLLFEI